jgi:hypothetical protein
LRLVHQLPFFKVIARVIDDAQRELDDMRVSPQRRLNRTMKKAHPQIQALAAFVI